MHEKEKIREELASLSPLLERLKEEGDGFRVPAHYFQALPDEVIGRLRAEEAAKAGTSLPSWWEHLSEQWRWLWQPRYAFAVATLAVLVTAGVWWWRASAVNTVDLAQLSDEEVTRYIAENIDYFPIDLLVEVESEAPPQPAILPAGDTLDEETIERYLEEVIDELPMEDLEKLL